VAARKLLCDEIALIRKLLEFGQRGDLGEGLEDAMVRPLEDGGLCLRFMPSDGTRRKFGTVVATAEAPDSDDVLISFALNLDIAGALFEWDAWKADYTPVAALPDAQKLQTYKT
jgi:hypothetical protein